MPGVLILGGTGYSGRRIARHLLRHNQADVTLGARHPDRAQALAETLNRQHSGGRARAVHADASQPESLRRAFSGKTVVVVAAPTTAYTEKVVRASLETEPDYLDIQLRTRKIPVLQPRAEEITLAGRCFITEAGLGAALAMRSQ